MIIKPDKKKIIIFVRGNGSNKPTAIIYYFRGVGVGKHINLITLSRH